MKGDRFSAEVIGLSSKLTALLARYDAGERSTLYPEMRELTDEVICLMDEAPQREHGVLGQLADRCETFLRLLAH